MNSVRQATAVRFSLRGVLIAIAVVGVFCAAVAPTVRGWSGADRIAFLSVWGPAILGWAGALGISIWLRIKAEQRAGAVLLSLQLHRPRLTLVMWIAVAMAEFAILSDLAFNAPHISRLRASIAAHGRTSYPNAAPPGAIALGAVLSLPTILLWWRGNRIDFCEHGILTLVRCTPWPVVDYEWLLSEPRLLMLCLTHRRIHVVVPDVSRAKVQEMLNRRYAPLATPAQDFATRETPS